MTKDQARRLAEVAGWIAEGIEVQERMPMDKNGRWADFKEDNGMLTCNWEYRKKPKPMKPREWWEVRTDYGRVFINCRDEGAAKVEAANWSARNQKHAWVAHCREVLP